MKFVLISLLFLFFIITNANSDVTKEIVKTLEKSNNYNFEFVQKINEKKETGNCILVFNKKIICKYNNSNKILLRYWPLKTQGFEVAINNAFYVCIAAFRILGNV